MQLSPGTLRIYRELVAFTYGFPDDGLSDDPCLKSLAEEMVRLRD